MSAFAFLQRYRDRLGMLPFRPIVRRLHRSPRPPGADELRTTLCRVSEWARATYWISGHPGAAAIRELFPEIPRAKARAIAREIHTAGRRHAVLRAVADTHGLEAVLPLVECRGTGHLADQVNGRRGALLAFAHAGPFLTVPAGLLRLGLPCLMVTATGTQMRHPPSIEAWNAKQAEEDAPLFMKRALDRLAAGYCVLLAVDGDRGGGSVERALLGRRMAFRRGLAVIHALSGAPVIPVRAYWENDCRMIFEAEAPLPAAPLGAPRAQREAVMLDETVQWLERRLRAHPADLQLARVPYYLRLPRMP